MDNNREYIIICQGNGDMVPSTFRGGYDGVSTDPTGVLPQEA